MQESSWEKDSNWMKVTMAMCTCGLSSVNIVLCYQMWTDWWACWRRVEQCSGIYRQHSPRQV